MSSNWLLLTFGANPIRSSVENNLILCEAASMEADDTASIMQ